MVVQQFFSGIIRWMGNISNSLTLEIHITVYRPNGLEVKSSFKGLKVVDYDHQLGRRNILLRSFTQGQKICSVLLGFQWLSNQC